MSNNSATGALNRSSSGYSVTARMNRVPFTRLHVFIMAVVALVLFFDSYELLFNSVLSTVFTAKNTNMDATVLAIMLSSMFWGSFVGSPLLGRVADKFGRKRGLQICIVLYAVIVILVAISPNLLVLSILRFFSGFGIGACLPVAYSYVADVVPHTQRGRLIFIVSGISALGAPAVNFMTASMNTLRPFDLDGWRAAMIVGGIGGIIVFVVSFLLPESPRWLDAEGRKQQNPAQATYFEKAAETELTRFESAAGSSLVQPVEPPPAPPSIKGKFKDLFGPVYRRRTTLLFAMQFLLAWPTLGFYLGSGPILNAKGYNLNDSLIYVGVSTFGAPVGALVLSFIVDKFERRTLLITSGVLLILCGLLFAWGPNPVVSSITGFGFLFFNSISGNLLNTLGQEMFPTLIRSQASSTAWGLNRFASGLVPLTLVPLIPVIGALGVFGIIGAIIAVLIVVAIFFVPTGLNGKTLEESSQITEAEKSHKVTEPAILVAKEN